MKTISYFNFKKLWISASAILALSFGYSQTNVFDAIISQSPAHTYLTAAINQQGLAGALQNPNATLTVFAPTNDAFEDLAESLGTDIAGLLQLPNLTDVLLYHVLDVTAVSSSLSNGMIVSPLNTENTIKITVTPDGVYANHAEVTTADLSADNGVVHVIDKVILSVETVVDLGLNNPGFEILTTAVIQQGLVPVLSDPFGTFTVLAPTDEAFTALLTNLNITAAQLLDSPDLTGILLYHVFGSEIEAGDLTNGLLAEPLNDDNTIKVTVKSSGEIFFNQAQVIQGDVFASNGVIHALNQVLLPVNTVVDVAIDNDFTYLSTALIQQELLPVLSNPFGEFTVFAPTNAAFDALATQLNTDIAGLLALDNLTNILLYHVAPGVLEAADLVTGSLTMVSGDQAQVNVSGGVTINQANVTTPNVAAFNGVVHVIDQVIVPTSASVSSFQNNTITTFPNPTSEFVNFAGIDNAEIKFVDINGSVVMHSNYDGNPIDIKNLNAGLYFIYISTEQNQHVERLTIK